MDSACGICFVSGGEGRAEYIFWGRRWAAYITADATLRRRGAVTSFLRGKIEGTNRVRIMSPYEERRAHLTFRSPRLARVGRFVGRRGGKKRFSICHVLAAFRVGDEGGIDATRREALIAAFTRSCEEYMHRLRERSYKIATCLRVEKVHFSSKL